MTTAAQLLATMRGETGGVSGAIGEGFLGKCAPIARRRVTDLRMLRPREAAWLGRPYVVTDAAARTASAASSGASVPSTGTSPGMRRIHFRW